MISSLFSSFVYNPLYNGLIFFVGNVPYADVGIAVILLTIIVKVVLLPLAHIAIRSQIVMNAIKPELEAIRAKYKDNKQEQAKQTMSLYKDKKINPFAMIIPLFIQIPIIFGLYWVFFKGGLPNVNTDILYSFITIPDVINMQFIGLVDVGGKSLVMAILAGITQYIHTKISFPKLDTKNKEKSFKNDLAKSMHIQMRYVLPIIVGVISYTISAAIALYWTTSNIFAILQEVFIRKRMLREADSSRGITSKDGSSSQNTMSGDDSSQGIVHDDSQGNRPIDQTKKHVLEVPKV